MEKYTEGMIPLEECFDKARFGNKSRNLAILAKAGLKIPSGFVIPSDYLSNNLSISIENASEDELLSIVPKNPFQGREGIVRSSSCLEDMGNFSGAGMYYSGRYNNENYASQLLRVWRSPYSNSVKVIKSKLGLPIEENIAVIAMEYVKAKLGGVLFTKHPSFKEMVLELSENGSSGVTSGQDKVSLFELPRDIKQNPIFEEIYTDAQHIENLFGSPQDIELLLTDKEVIYLQSRPVVFKKHILVPPKII